MPPPGRKIDPELEDPVDDLLLRLVTAMSPAFRKTGHTPNVLTLYSGVFGAAAVWALWKGRKGAFVALYAVSYFFDCADGDFARRYDMVTELGDKLDHGKDFAVWAGLVCVLLARYRFPLWAWGAWGLSLLLMTVHLGCQQRDYAARRPAHDPASESLDSLTNLCISENGRSGLRTTRWFGVGTTQVVFLLLVYFAAIYRRK